MLFTLNKKHILSFVVLILSLNPIFAGCGSCETKNEAPATKKSSALVTAIPESGIIEGFVITSCGICNLGYKKDKGCSLTVKIGDTVYPVEGTSIHEHGDAHSTEGFCNALRIAHVSGEVKKNKFHSTSFTLIESPN